MSSMLGQRIDACTALADAQTL
eukprot:SAG22_NODE_5920_length_931_cov_1.167067_1_plen_21_part_10